MKNLIKMQAALAAKNAEGSVETAIKVLTAVVLGALVLTILYGILTSTVKDKTTEKINSLYSYSSGAVVA